jgi:peptide deformylase
MIKILPRSPVVASSSQDHLISTLWNPTTEKLSWTDSQEKTSTSEGTLSISQVSVPCESTVMIKTRVVLVSFRYATQRPSRLPE